MHVLRTFVDHFLHGRALDIKDPKQVLEGETAEINLFEDGLEELICEMGHDPKSSSRG